MSVCRATRPSVIPTAPTVCLSPRIVRRLRIICQYVESLFLLLFLFLIRYASIKPRSIVTDARTAIRQASPRESDCKESSYSKALVAGGMVCCIVMMYDDDDEMVMIGWR